MKRMILLIAAFSLAGCSTLGREFDNKLLCSPDGKAFVVSMYGPLGIASKIDTLNVCQVAAQGAQK